MIVSVFTDSHRTPISAVPDVREGSLELKGRRPV